ncbi:TonB family protein [Massilia sp. DJPM01]|uniref:TonB family protein n=1 Tax=Massilia sp. DJPM01 TaxID=3024404 RepID=UPI00259DA199|nr:TonB family protein [Massilia sp. DJPM01]MDM5181732.1 TonB family protein [Massilia sp. DJPM01]
MATTAHFLSLHHPRRFAALAVMLATVCSQSLAQRSETPLTIPVAPAAGTYSTNAALRTAEHRECGKPEYPKAALRYDQQGTVTLAFLIGVDGVVKDSKIVKSSGFQLLDIAAHNGLVPCKFKPAQVDGKAIESWMQMQYVWTIDNSAVEGTAATLADTRAAAERGEPQAQYALGISYMDGAGVAQDPAQALAWWRKAAAQDHAAAHMAVGLAFHLGIGEKQDRAQAASWYRKAADLGLPQAQHRMGMLAMAQPGYARDVDAAREWFRKGAAQGYAPSQAFYGGLLMKGVSPEWIEHGLALVRKAAAQNDVQGQFLLGRCYENGNGVARDVAQAAALYEQAALNGSKPAQESIAAMYEQGRGVAADPVKAAKWRKIAEKPLPQPR